MCHKINKLKNTDRQLVMSSISLNISSRPQNLKKNFLFGKMGNHLVLGYTQSFFFFSANIFFLNLEGTLQAWKSDYLGRVWVLWFLFFKQQASITLIIRHAYKQHSFITWSSPKGTVKQQFPPSATPWKHLGSFKKKTPSHAWSYPWWLQWNVLGWGPGLGVS